VTQAGGEVHLDTSVRSIDVVGSRAVGLSCEKDGERFAVRAEHTLSCVDARTTLLGLVGAQCLRVDELRAVRSVAYAGCVARFVFDVEDGASGFETWATEFEGVRLYPITGPGQLEAVMSRVRRRSTSREPWIEVVPLRTADRRFVLLVHAHGLGVDAQTEDVDRFARSARSQIQEHGLAGNLTERLALRRCSASWQHRLGIHRGDGFHGALRLEQMFALRPLPHWGSSRHADAGDLADQAGWPTSIDKLDFCGAAAHPGGFVTGLPGWLAALRTQRSLVKSGIGRG
jgi:phytoene dehydrogenase-like protein